MPQRRFDEVPIRQYRPGSQWLRSIREVRPADLFVPLKEVQPDQDIGPIGPDDLAQVDGF